MASVTANPGLVQCGMPNHFETIVIGLGAMGSAATYQLAKRGNKVLGLDQFSPPHHYGSSHGDTRVTRQAIGEGAEYMPLVLRSYALWEEIERETGTTILTVTGGLIMTSVDGALRHGSSFFEQTVACAEAYGIPHRLMDAEEIRMQFPQFRLKGTERGYFEENMGYLRPEAAVGAQLALAQRYGGTLAFHEKVQTLSLNRDQTVQVKTNKGEYTAEKAIVASGPWVTHLLGQAYAPYFTVYRQVLYWFEVDRPIARFEAPRFPVWIWEFGENVDDLMYGFPAVDGAAGGVKIAAEQYMIPTDADRVSRKVSEEEITTFYRRYVRPHFADVTATSIKAVPCLYTVTPDHRFVIDRHPELPQIIVASPCSGHGFKHSVAIGEVLAQLVTNGKSEIDIRVFSFDRFIAK